MGAILACTAGNPLSRILADYGKPEVISNFPWSLAFGNLPGIPSRGTVK